MSKQDSFLQAIKEVQQSFKSIPIGTIDSLPRIDVEKFHTGSLILDSIIGGGIPKGRIIEIFGPESSGKSSIALTVAADVQRKGGNVVYLDIEQTLDPAYAIKLGIDMKKLVVSQPMIAEDTLNMIKLLCKSGEVDLIVVDSVASMVPRAEDEKEIGQASVAVLARLLSQGLKQIIGVASQTNTTIIFLNQIRNNVGNPYGPQFNTTGGNALKFYASMRIEVKRKKTVEEEGDVVGTEVQLQCVKNKVAPPFGKGLTVLTFNKGINKAAELKVLGEELGIIERRGRSYFYKPPYPISKEDLGEFNSVIEDGEVKLGTSNADCLKELEENKFIYELIGNDVTYEIKRSQGLLSEEEVEKREKTILRKNKKKEKSEDIQDE